MNAKRISTIVGMFLAMTLVVGCGENNEVAPPATSVPVTPLPVADTNPPQLTAFNFPATVDLTNGPATVRVDYSATDDLSGVSFVYFDFQGPGLGCGGANAGGGDFPNGGLAVSRSVTFQLGQYSTPLGTYVVCEVSISDTAGNSRTYPRSALQGLGFPTAFTVTGTGVLDTTAPTLTALSFPASVDVTDRPATVRVDYDATDDLSGVSSFSIEFRGPGLDCGGANAGTGNSSEGGLAVSGSVSFQLGQYSTPPGTYVVCALWLYDAAGNARSYTVSALQGLGFPTAFTVTGTGVLDTTAPALTALSFPASVDVTNGPATVQVDYRATDDLSGVTYFYLQFQGPGLVCGGANAGSGGSPEGGLASSGSVSFQLGQYSTPPGTYVICALSVYDAAGNLRSYPVSELQGLGFPTAFTVTGTGVLDTAAPLLTALSFPASVDVTNGPATVQVDYSATDDLSGVTYFYVQFQGPGLACGGANASSGDSPAEGLAVSRSVGFQLGPYSTPPGSYVICALSLYDAAGNVRSYTVSELQGLGFPTAFTVTGTGVLDTMAPALTALSLPASVDVTNGPATVRIDYSATDDLSGVTYFYIQFQGPGSACGGANANTGDSPNDGLAVSRSVSFQLGPYSTPPGTYVICALALYDAAGNLRSYTQSALQGLGFPTAFTVTGTGVLDTVAPALTALSFPPSVDVTDGPATVQVDYSATDDLSGVRYFSIQFQGPGLGCGGANASTEGSPDDGLAVSRSVSFQLGQYSTPSGTYVVCALRLYDAAGNVRSYTVPALQALGFPTAFTVASPNG